MQQRALFLILSSITILCSGPIRGQPSPEKLILVPVSGTGSEDIEISRWQERIRSGDATRANIERLGWAFVSKGRCSLDMGFYKLAGAAADAMDRQGGSAPDSLLLRGHVLHSLHHFSEAEKVARELVAARGLAFDYALLSDALMEQGKLTDAVEACQRSVNLRPGIETYSRVAHLRWLKGDLDGAIVAMETALRAGSARGGEAQAWGLTRLSSYQLQAGKAALALELSRSAQRAMGQYAPAQLAEGRAQLALGQVAEAVAVLRKAAQQNPLPEYQWWLADALRLAGNETEAKNVESLIVQTGTLGDPRSVSIFLATKGLMPSRAVDLARSELAVRTDVFTYDALAWALAAAGQNAEADTYADRALAEQTRDARLLFHAAVIKARTGRVDEAQRYLRSAEASAGTLTPSEQAAHGRPRVRPPARSGPSSR